MEKIIKSLEQYKWIIVSLAIIGSFVLGTITLPAKVERCENRIENCEKKDIEQDTKINQLLDDSVEIKSILKKMSDDLNDLKISVGIIVGKILKEVKP